MDARCFLFGPFVLIPERQVLLKGDTPVRIGSRALDILTQLVQRPGEVIDKQELIALVWAGIFVDESNLKVNIAALRKAIDDEASNRSCIATVIGRGYRFVEPVQKLSLEGSFSPSKKYCTPPDFTNPLTGRDRIDSQLVEQVAAHRLVTIVGAPGAGKSAVATVVARSIFEQPGSTVRFADLSSAVRDRNTVDVVTAAAREEQRGVDTNEWLLAALESRQMLLVFDDGNA